MEYVTHLTNWAWHMYSAQLIQSAPKIGLFIAIVLAVLLMEVLYSGWQSSACYRILSGRSRSARTDLFYFIADLLYINAILSILFSLGLARGLVWLLQHYFDLRLMSKIPSLPLQIIVALLVQDFAAYWLHRFLHRVDFCWELHRVHHSAEEFNVITAIRTHPMESAAQQIVRALTLVLLGTPFDTYLLVIILQRAHPALVHSMLPWNWGWIGKYILISPMVHRVHHSTEKRHFDKNFGSIFVFWDHLFGTFHGEAVAKPTFGEANNMFNQKFFIIEQYQAYRRMFSKLAGRLYVKEHP